MSTNSRLTQTLQEAAGGSPEAVADLMPLVYSELRASAGKQLRRERRNHTLQATALANEAYLRLVDQEDVDWKGRAHFLRVSHGQTPHLQGRTVHRTRLIRVPVPSTL